MRFPVPRPALWLSLVLAVAVIAVGAACGDDDDDNGDVVPTATAADTADGDGDGDDAAAAEAAIRAAIDAWNGQDVEGFLAAFTDQGFMAAFDASKEEGAEFIPGFMADASLSVEGLEVEVSDGTATGTGVFFFFAAGSYEQLSLVREGDVWLIDGAAYVTGEAPEGATLIDLSLLEYQFGFDVEAITSGNFAFAVENIGGEEHEVAIFSIPEDLDLEQAIQSEEEPEGVAPIGFLGPYDPGDATTIIFSEPLAPGRYAMLCFVETADGEDHASLGMFAEFTIE